MAERENKTKKNTQEGDQKGHLTRKESPPLSQQFHAWEQGALSIGETPFWPRTDAHAEMLARVPSHERRYNLVMHLQQTYGNRYVQRLVEPMKVQAKLTVNAPNDVYEQEADGVAEAVTRTIASSAQRQEEEMAMSKPTSTIQRQEEEEGEKPVQMNVSHSQRQEVPEEEEVQTTLLSSVQRQEEEEEPVQAKTALETQRQELPEEEVQTQPAENQPATVSENLETRINSARGSGQSLSDTIREPMEHAFGADFSGVRVHTNSEADTLNQQLSAKAFTAGQDIFFREGEYSPDSGSGQEVLAHELTHVVQQNGSTIQRSKTSRVTKERSPRANKISRQAQSTVQRYEERTHKKGDYRLADDKSMIVKQDSTAGSQLLVAKPGMAAASSAKLASVGSVLELKEGRKIKPKIADSGPALQDSKDGTKTEYCEIIPRNKTTKTSGTKYSKGPGGGMAIWDDCGRAARAIMGAEKKGVAKAVYKGPKGKKKTKRTTAPHKMKRELMLTYLLYWEKKHGEKKIDSTKLAGLKKSYDDAVKKAQAISLDVSKTEDEKDEAWGEVGYWDEQISECYWDSYNSASAKWREDFDKWAKINRWAAPEVGEGYTISTGGKAKPGEEASTWNFHWAGVIMKGGKETVTLEGYAGSAPTDWVYQMYGSASAAEADASKKEQTFQEQHRDVARQHGETPTTMVVKK